MATRYTQPQAGPLEIDPYWLRRGLVYALVGTPTGMVDASPNRLSGSYPASVIGKQGYGSSFTGSQSQTLSYSPPSGAFTTRIAAIRLASSSGVYALSGPAGGISNFEFRINSGGISIVDAGVFEYVNAGSIAPGEDCVIGGVYGTGRQEAWKNGVLVGSATGAPSTPSHPVVIGERGNSAEFFNGLMYLQAEFTGLLEYQELQLLTANPWQLFKAPRRVLRVAGGGTPATATPSGVSAASAAGTPAATGAALATPSGVQASSAIGVPVSTGAAVAKPSGVQAISAIGVPVASAGASATATPAGVQATSVVGAPIATGGAVAHPAGVQADSAVGTPTATGAAIANPTGVQAVSAVGTPIATGGAVIPGTAYPAGVQATSAIGVTVATGAALALPTGVQAATAVGAPTAMGGGNAYAFGVQAVSYIGTPFVPQAATTYPVGVQVISFIGIPTATGQPTEFGSPLIVTPTPRNWISSSDARPWAASNAPRN